MSPTTPNPLGTWCQFKQRFLTWQDGSSFDLPSLSDDILRDIGLSRGSERFTSDAVLGSLKLSIPGRHSITSSATKRKSREIVRPRSFAAFRLMTSSNFVGCSTGNSAGFAPLRILST